MLQARESTGKILPLLVSLVLLMTLLPQKSALADEDRGNMNSIACYAVTEDGKPVETLLTSRMTIGADVYCEKEQNAMLVATLYHASMRAIGDEKKFLKRLRQGENHLAAEIDLNAFGNYNPMYSWLQISLVDAQDASVQLAEPLLLPPGSLPGEDVFEYDSVRFRFYVGPDTEQVKALLIIDAHGTGISLFHDMTFRGILIENDWAAMICSDRGDIPETREMISEFTKLADRGDAAIETAIAYFAADRGHPEAVNVPRATFGHSAASSFAIKYGAMHPDKVFASIGWRTPDRPQFTWLSKDVPVLVLQGEIDSSYGNNVNQVGLCVDLVQQGYPVTYTLSPGADHGSGGAIVDRSIIFAYLLRAYEARVPADADFTQAPAELKPINFSTGYYGDLTNVYSYFVTANEKKEYEFGKIGVYTNAANEYSWLWDEHFANQWKEYSETRDIIRYK